MLGASFGLELLLDVIICLFDGIRASGARVVSSHKDVEVEGFEVLDSVDDTRA